MNYFLIIVEIISGASVIIGTISAFGVWLKRLIEGQKCQLRSDMLRIYYDNKDAGKIRQYEAENFIFMYKAYKALKGNSFIDIIYNEVKTWDIIP
jgi:hypothetical protein